MAKAEAEAGGVKSTAEKKHGRSVGAANERAKSEAAIGAKVASLTKSLERRANRQLRHFLGEKTFRIGTNTKPRIGKAPMDACSREAQMIDIVVGSLGRHFI